MQDRTGLEVSPASPCRIAQCGFRSDWERPVAFPTRAFVDSVWFGNDPLLLTEGLGRGFCTSIQVVRVSAKLLKILIAALSPSVAY
jgi:hypothetical protein